MSSDRKPMTLHRLRTMHAAGEKIATLTCYDASFAQLIDGAGVDVMLVGDSLGMVLQGHDSTVPVESRLCDGSSACRPGCATDW